MKNKIIIIIGITLIIYGVAMAVQHFGFARADDRQEWIAEAGIMTDMSRPHDPLTREEAALMLTRFYDYIQKNDKRK